MESDSASLPMRMFSITAEPSGTSRRLLAATQLPLVIYDFFHAKAIIHPHYIFVSIPVQVGQLSSTQPLLLSSPLFPDSSVSAYISAKSII